MIDKDKVCKGLFCCSTCTNDDPFNMCDECPYNEVSISVQECRAVLCKDALELMARQEAVTPNTRPSAKGYWYTCGVCGWPLFEVRDTVHFDGRKHIRFCASCGGAVKW